MEGCYWIALPDQMARRDCDKEIFYLSRERINGFGKETLIPYAGTKCPKCGKPIIFDEHSYDLIKDS